MAGEVPAISITEAPAGREGCRGSLPGPDPGYKGSSKPTGRRDKHDFRLYDNE